MVIIGWALPVMGEALQIMGLLDQMYLASDLINWAD